jgi:hypothetical protein
MTVDWQQIVAFLIVAAAIVVLWRRARGLWKSPDKGCGSGCQSCAVAEGTPAKPLVSLDPRSPNDPPSPAQGATACR